jgi:putative endonuclease
MMFVYMLECCDCTYYTGWTTDVERRLRMHQAGRGAKYTRARLPVKLVYAEICVSPRAAMRREYAIKRLPRREKRLLVAAWDGLIVREEG